jgi:steroid delta-isomerase-like uncharacterized protein
VSLEDNKALLRRGIEEVINRGNFAVADEIIASDYVYRSPGTPEVRGPDGLKQLVQGYRTAFPDLNMSVQEQIAEGDSVMTRWTATGTHRGELMGIPPTGKQVNVMGMIISRCAGGKIVEEVEIFDAMGMMQQLGVVPAAAEPAGASA